MFLLTTLGFVFEKDNWVQFIKEKNIKKVILIRLVKKDGPFNWSRDQVTVLKEIERNKQYSSKDKENLTKAFQAIVGLLELLRQLYLEFEYHELREDEAELKKTAYIAKIVVQQSFSGIIDIARGERILVASFFKIAQYFPEKIVEFGLSDFSKKEFIPIITTFLDPDPDQRKKTTYKEILSLFLPSSKTDYATIAGLVKYNATEIEEKVPELAASHLKNRLSNMTQKAPGKPELLSGIEDPKDKRKSIYNITDYGLFALYVNYLRQIINKNCTYEDKWIINTKKACENINFDNCYEVCSFNPFSK